MSRFSVVFQDGDGTVVFHDQLDANLIMSSGFSDSGHR